MEISCPSCHNRFEALTRRAVCDFCGTQLDVWALVSGHSPPPPPPTPPPISHGADESRHEVERRARDPYATNLATESTESVLDLPLSEISQEHTDEADPVLDPAFSALPKELAEIATPTGDSIEATAAQGSQYHSDIAAPEAEPSSRGMGKGLLLLVPLAVVILAGGYYLSRPSNGDNGSSATITAPTIVPAPGPTSSVEASATPTSVPTPDPSPSATLEAKTRVSPTPAAPAESTPPPAPDTSSDAQTRARAVNPPLATAKYTLQITAMPTEAEARQVAQKMIDAGLDAKIIKATVAAAGGAEGRTWYRVRVGAFTTKEDAVQYGDQLKRSGKVETYFVTDLR
jgi:cell division septation protein DedD